MKVNHTFLANDKIKGVFLRKECKRSTSCLRVNKMTVQARNDGVSLQRELTSKECKRRSNVGN